MCPWASQEGGLIAARPVATDQAFPSICPLGELGMCGDMRVKREEVGKSQAPSQLGEGEEGLDIKGWAGQLPAHPARWSLSGQAQHSQDNGVSCSLSGQQESLPSQGTACS